MSTEVELQLNNWLPDALAINEFHNLVEKQSNGIIELDSGTMKIEFNCQHQVVSKSLICQRNGVGFGNCFRVLLAVGGVANNKYGIPKARYCFATLWFNLDLHLMTMDFSENYPCG